MTIKSVLPDWNAPSHIKAFTTTRHGGVSKGIYEGLNLATHVGDESRCVVKNRELLNLSSQPHWLEQTHSTHCLDLDSQIFEEASNADAAYTQQENKICVVMTADCLPIILTDIKGSFVSAIHAGWRGLADGIVERQLELLKKPTGEMLAWIGPAISQKHFEVGQDVFDAFVNKSPVAKQAFVSKDNGKYLADLFLLARQILNSKGVNSVHGGQHCTFENSEDFYSYRRDGQTGRIATFIWMQHSN